MKYRTCPDCGANIDFGERCDCKEVETRAAEQQQEKTKAEKVTR